MAEETTNPQLTRPFLKIYGGEVTGTKRPTSYIEALIHIVKGYVGTGIFAMGAAFLNSGMLLGPLLLIAMTLLCLHCQHIIVKACVRVSEEEVVDVLPSYAETVQYTFEDSASKVFNKCAKIAAALTDISLLIAEYGSDIVYMIFVSTHITEIASAHGFELNYRLWLCVFLIPMWMSVFLTNLRFLTPLSLISNILSWIGIGIILYYTSLDLESIKERSLISNLTGLPKSIGIALFAFQGITFILNVRMEMKNRQQFTTPFGVLNVSIAIVAFLYILVGFMAYWKYGDCVKGSTFLNLPEREVLSEATKAIMAVSVAMTYTLHMYIPFEIAYPIFYRRYGPFKHPKWIMACYRSFWVLVTFIFANIDSRLDSFIGLVGAISGGTVTLLLPALVDVAMVYGESKKWAIAKDILIVIIAIAGVILGAGLSIYDIIEHIKSDISANSTEPEHCKRNRTT